MMSFERYLDDEFARSVDESTRYDYDESARTDESTRTDDQFEGDVSQHFLSNTADNVRTLKSIREK